MSFVAPTGGYLLTGLLRSAVPALACKSCACRPWQARSPAQASTGLLPLSGSPPAYEFFRLEALHTDGKAVYACIAKPLEVPSIDDAGIGLQGDLGIAIER